jgi:hypothetical protein
MSKSIQNMVTVHTGFCLLVLLFSYTVPDLARCMARVVSPLAAVMFWVMPTYPAEHQLTGPLGPMFYTSMVGEGFFMSMVCAVACVIVTIARYWRRPWRFGEVFVEQQGLQNSYVSTLILGLVTLALAALIGFVLYIWFGFGGAEIMNGPIKAHQLMLWSLLVVGAGLSFPIAAMLAMSTLLFLTRRIATASV